MISRRFVPPAIDALREGPRYEAACAREAAREEGFADGLRAGREEGYATGLREGEARAAVAYHAELEKLRATYARQHTVEVIHTALQHLLAAREQTRLALETDARAVLRAALNTLFPVFLSRAAGTELAALVDAAVRERGAASVVVRAHPDTLAAVQEQGLAATDTLAFLPDPALPLGTAVTTWSGGGLSFEPAELLRQIDTLLSPEHPHYEAVSA
jgi:flagellar biosynthesis/type III secretory pathway protein FliH